jgi:hypothetical protein
MNEVTMNDRAMCGKGLAVNATPAATAGELMASLA